MLRIFTELNEINACFNQNTYYCTEFNETTLASKRLFLRSVKEPITLRSAILRLHYGHASKRNQYLNSASAI